LHRASRRYPWRIASIKCWLSRSSVL